MEVLSSAGIENFQFDSSRDLSEINSVLSHLVNETVIKMESTSCESDIDEKMPESNWKSEKIENNSSKREPPILIEIDDDDDEVQCVKENINSINSTVSQNKTPNIVPKLPQLTRINETKDVGAGVEKIKKIISTLSREELEAQFMKRVLHSIESNNQVTRLEIKVRQMMTYKDEIAIKAISLHKQVIELTKAMKTISSTSHRNPNQGHRANVPVKFVRSVGIQSRTEMLPKLMPLDKFKTINNGGFTPPPAQKPMPARFKNAEGLNGVVGPKNPAPPSSTTGQKRVNKPTISINELREKLNGEPSKVPRKNPAPSPQQRNSNGPLKPKSMSNGLNKAPSQESVIDLTDDVPDDPPPPKAKEVPKFTISSSRSGTGYHVVSTNPAPPSRATSASQLAKGQLLTRPPLTPKPGPRPPLLTPGPRHLSPPQQGNFRTNSPISVRAMSPGAGALQRSRFSTPQLANGGILNVNASRTFTIRFTLPELPGPLKSVQPRNCTKEAPPRPTLSLTAQSSGIVLSWTHKVSTNYAEIQSYQIYACQEPLPHATQLAKSQVPAWKSVGIVKALPLPMACTLSQFTDENRYYFIVRGVDVYNRSGPFCETVDIVLQKKIN